MCKQPGKLNRGNKQGCVKDAAESFSVCSSVVGVNDCAGRQQAGSKLEARQAEWR